MSEDEDKTVVSLDGFTLGPDWGKGSSGALKANDYSGGDDPRDARRRSDHGDRRGAPRGDSSRRDSGGGGQGRGGLYRDAAPRTPRFADAPATSDRDRPRQRHDSAAPRRDAPPHEAPEQRIQLDELPYEIRFLPEQGALDLIAAKILRSRRAIPLPDLVKLFYANPDTIDVRLEFREDHKDERFFRCKKCAYIASTAAELTEHVRGSHFAEFFAEEHIETEAPKGVFKAVMRDGFTGKLLAPPNHHSLAVKITQALREGSSARNEDEFRARMETVTDPEIIEQWKSEASKQTVYARKQEEKQENAKIRKSENTEDSQTLTDGENTASEEAQPQQEEAPTPETSSEKFTYENAIEVFNKEILHTLLSAERHITLTHESAKTIKDPMIARAISVAWDREQRIMTAALFFAVRGGLRGRGLALFRVSPDKRDEWVSCKMPVALDASLAVAGLRAVLEKINDQPGITKADLFAELAPESAGPETAEETKKQFAFAIDRGYVIESFNGSLSLGADYEKYNHEQPRRN